MEIRSFDAAVQDAILDLIVDIQRKEFGLDIDAERQPDLTEIPSFYQVGCGNFWVATDTGRVIGTAALLDIGNHQAALRKMFVASEFRGSNRGVASALLAVLIEWAAHHGVREIFLGTTSAFHAAHRFYEKNGFSEITPAMLPPAFPIMHVDKKFYVRRLSNTLRQSLSSEA